MSIKDIISGFLKKKDEFKNIEDEERYREKLAEKKKSANERELERFVEEYRQKNIKIQLEHFRKRRQMEDNKNIFTNNKYLFKDKHKILAGKAFK